MRNMLFGAGLLLISTTSSVNADYVSYLESGYVTFEGCDWEQIINLENGYVWECGEYGYAYHYGKMTVLRIKGTTKLCVGDVDKAIKEFPNGKCYSGTLHRW